MDTLWAKNGNYVYLRFVVFKSIHFVDPMVWTYLIPKAKNGNFVYLRPVTLGAGLMEPHMRCDGQELST